MITAQKNSGTLEWREDSNSPGFTLANPTQQWHNMFQRLIAIEPDGLFRSQTSTDKRNALCEMKIFSDMAWP